MLGYRCRKKGQIIEVAGQDKSTVIFDFIPGKLKESLFGLEITHLQCAVNLSMHTALVEYPCQFLFGEDKIFHTLAVVKIRQPIQGELLLAGQYVKSFAFSQHRSHTNCIGKNER